MHHPDEQGAHAQLSGMSVFMMFRIVWRRVTGMRMRVQVDSGVGMSVNMKVYPLAGNAPKYVEPQQHQHDADREFERLSEAFRHHEVQREHEAAEQQQGERVSQSLGRAELDRLGK